MRLPTITDEEATGEVKLVFDEIVAKRGFVSNALRSLGHSPQGLRALIGVGTHVKFESSLPWRAREVVIMTAGREVEYEWHHHYGLAIDAGVPEQALDAIRKNEAPLSLPEEEQALVAATNELLGPSGISEATFERVKRHWSSRQIVDFLLTAVYYSGIATLAKALGVELEEDEAVFTSERAWQRALVDSET